MKIHTFYKLFPKLLTSYVNVHIIFIFNSILSCSPVGLVRCRLGCLTCIATQKLNVFSHLFFPRPSPISPPRFTSAHLLWLALLEWFCPSGLVSAGHLLCSQASSLAHRSLCHHQLPFVCWLLVFNRNVRKCKKTPSSNWARIVPFAVSCVALTAQLVPTEKHIQRSVGLTQPGPSTVLWSTSSEPYRM